MFPIVKMPQDIGFVDVTVYGCVSQMYLRASKDTYVWEDETQLNAQYSDL